MMLITEFCQKHNVSKRSVDYWTNIGLLHPTVNEQNGYRDYGRIAEEEIKRIKLLKEINNGHVKKSDFDTLNGYSVKEWEEEIRPRIYQAYREQQDYYKDLLDYINDQIDQGADDIYE